MSAEPTILLDAAGEGYCESRGWVEASVSEGRARDLLAPFCSDEHGESPCRPDCGPARKVILAPSTDPATSDPEAARWYPIDRLRELADDFDERCREALEFWEVPVL